MTKKAIPVTTKPLSTRRIVLTAGMGFFTDAYDLFIIGVVTAILTPLWHLSLQQLVYLNSASLAAAAFGAIVFGILSDRFGRRSIYGLEIMILFFGAIISACSQSFYMLLFARIIMGIGIGGDYPTSAVVASESANHHRRGFVVLLVFAMQAVGLIVGPLLASLLLSMNLSADTVWRLLLGFGAIPAATAFYLRRQLAETSHFIKKHSLPVEVSRVVADLTGNAHLLISPIKKPTLWQGKYIKYVIGTSSAWFLLDVVFYGNGISATMILSHISPNGSLTAHTLWSALMFFCFAVPGYLLAAKYIDKIGRRSLQVFGFVMIAVCYLLIAALPQGGGFFTNVGFIYCCVWFEFLLC